MNYLLDIFTKKEEMSTERIAKTVLGIILMHKFKDNVSTSMNYNEYDGTNLPAMAGYNYTNAAIDYIDSGGKKSEAIEKFLDRNLRSREQIKELVEYLVEILN
jgi:hypothetical protein